MGDNKETLKIRTPKIGKSKLQKIVIGSFIALILFFTGNLELNIGYM